MFRPTHDFKGSYGYELSSVSTRDERAPRTATPKTKWAAGALAVLTCCPNLLLCQLTTAGLLVVVEQSRCKARRTLVRASARW